jgi:hypothetical protein
MFGLEIIEAAIGLSLVYLLLASICSAMREGIEALQKTRAVDLERAIRELLQDPTGTGLTKKLFDHPLISGLFAGRYDPAEIDERTGHVAKGTRLPSYIPAANFAAALLDVVARGPFTARNERIPTTPVTAHIVREAAALPDNAAVERVILIALDRAGDDLAKAQAQIEAWFNSAMDRVSGWYRRRTRKIIFWLSLVLTLAANANTLTLLQRLSIDSSMRQALMSQAQQVGTPVASIATASVPAAMRLGCAAIDRGAAQSAITASEAFACLGQLALPLGWSEGWPGLAGDPLADDPDHFAFGEARTWWRFVLQPLVGLLLTTFAVTLGAPFWFDTLNKLVSIRSSLKPEES